MSDRDDEVRKAIRASVKAISSAQALLICAGAGMGVDSGLPDFRGDDGLWKAYPPLAKGKVRFEDLARPSQFREHPELAWAFYGHRQKLYFETEPHAGYSELLRWCRGMEDGFFVYTSNVDGHFHKARFPGQQIVEIHGHIHCRQCMEGCGDNIWMEAPDVVVDPASLEVKGRLPHCPYCGGLARPNVMMFGDGEWLSTIVDHQYARYVQWLRNISRKRLVIIEIGAGTDVPTVRQESESLVANRNATLIRINPDEPSVPAGSISLPLTAAEAIEKIKYVLPRTVKERFKQQAHKALGRHPALSMSEAIEKAAKTNPGLAVSTAPLALRAIKAQKAYAKGFQVKLPSGWTAWVDTLVMTHTHGGILEGLPLGGASAATRSARAWASERLAGPEPIVLAPECFDPTSETPIVPPLQFAAQICSLELMGTDTGGSWMNLVWFAEVDDEKSVVDFVSEALAQVDWSTQASSYDI
jgi:NAD-dependent SIR2 family protein deacetylase